MSSSNNTKTTAEHKKEGGELLMLAFEAFHEAAMPTRRDEVGKIASKILEEAFEVPMVVSRSIDGRRTRKKDALEALAAASNAYKAAGEIAIAGDIDELGTDIVGDDKWSDLTEPGVESI